LSAHFVSRLGSFKPGYFVSLSAARILSSELPVGLLAQAVNEVSKTAKLTNLAALGAAAI